MATWALLDPLLRLWGAASVEEFDLVEQVGEWLIDAPYEAVAEAVEPGSLGDAVRSVTGFLDNRPGLTQRLYERTSLTSLDSLSESC